MSSQPSQHQQSEQHETQKLALKKEFFAEVDYSRTPKNSPSGQLRRILKALGIEQADWRDLFDDPEYVRIFMQSFSESDWLQPQGINIPDDANIVDIAVSIRGLQGLQRANAWTRGAIASWVRRKFYNGHMPASAMSFLANMMDVSPQRLANNMTTHDTWPPETRRPGISNTHHEELNALDAETRQYWLDEIEANGLTLTKLRIGLARDPDTVLAKLEVTPEQVEQPDLFGDYKASDKPQSITHVPDQIWSVSQKLLEKVFNMPADTQAVIDERTAIDGFIYRGHQANSSDMNLTAYVIVTMVKERTVMSVVALYPGLTPKVGTMHVLAGLLGVGGSQVIAPSSYMALPLAMFLPANITYATQTVFDEAVVQSAMSCMSGYFDTTKKPFSRIAYAHTYAIEQRTGYYQFAPVNASMVLTGTGKEDYQKVTIGG